MKKKPVKDRENYIEMMKKMEKNKKELEKLIKKHDPKKHR